MKRPTTLEELVAAPPGTAVCDMHDGLPGSMDTGFVTRCRVPREIVDILLCQSHVEHPEDGMSNPLVRHLVNKIAYKVATGEHVTTLAYFYDGEGWLITIEH